MYKLCYSNAIWNCLSKKREVNWMNHYEAINDVLVNLFNEILDLEERALITENIRIFPSMICTLLMQ